MTVDFSSEIMEARRKCHICKVLKEKSIVNSISRENILHEWRWNKTFSDEGRLRKFIPSTPALKKIAKGSSSHRKEMITERKLEHQQWRNSSRNGKYLVHIIDYFPLSFQNCVQWLKAKVTTWSTVVLNVHRGNIYKNYIIKGES